MTGRDVANDIRADQTVTLYLLLRRAVHSLEHLSAGYAVLPKVKWTICKRHIVQTLHSEVSVLHSRCLYKVKWNCHDLKQCRLSSRRVIRYQKALLFGKVHHVFYLSFQELVLRFELQRRSKYGPMHLRSFTTYKKLTRTLIFLRLNLSYSELANLQSANCCRPTAENCKETFGKFLAGLLHHIKHVLKQQVPGLAHQFSANQELLLPLLSSQV